MKDQIFKFCAMLLIPLMAVINCPVGSLAAEEKTQVEIKIKHKPVEQVVAGERIPIEVKVTAESGADVVRVYFKAIDAEEYSFVNMTPFEDDSFKGKMFSGTSFRGTLPAAANGAGSFNYLILIKNGKNQVVKSQTYNVSVEDNDNAEQAVAGNQQIEVYTELKEAPAEIAGFSDNIAIDVVESAAKLGVVAGLYSVATAGSTASGAVAGGTVASSLGLSTTGIVAGAAVTTAAVVGVAAAASDSGGSSSSSNTNSSACPYVGSWSGSYTQTNCDGSRESGPWTGSVNSSCFFSGSRGEHGLSGPIDPATGKSNLSGTAGCGRITGSAQFSGRSVRGNYGGSGVRGSFTGGS